MLHGELLSFIAEIKDKRTIFRQDNASIHTTVTTKKGGSNISEYNYYYGQHWPSPDQKPVGNSN